MERLHVDPSRRVRPPDRSAAGPAVAAGKAAAEVCPGDAGSLPGNVDPQSPLLEAADADDGLGPRRKSGEQPFREDVVRRLGHHDGRRFDLEGIFEVAVGEANAAFGVALRRCELQGRPMAPAMVLGRAEGVDSHVDPG